jgi:acetate kinase
VVNTLNKQSGHFGITGGRFVDRRDIEKAMNEGDAQAKLSLEMEIYRIKKYIGAYMAVLGDVDAIVFTAGVGENNSTIREGALNGLERLGIILDKEKNKIVRSSSGETRISRPESPVQVLVIPTNEEAVLVEDVVAILEGRYDEHTKYVYRFEA